MSSTSDVGDAAIASPKTGVRQARAAQTETALKEAARRVFARQGYLKTKITDITAEAGRASGSFYNHFASKEELLEALARDFLSQADEGFSYHGHHDLSDREVLRQHVGIYWHTYRTHLPEIVAMTQASMMDDVFAARIRKLRADNTQPICEHLEYLRKAGFTLPGEPIVVASAMMGMLQQFCETWLAGGGEQIGRPLSDDEAIDTLTDLLLRGIIGSPAEGQNVRTADADT